MLQLLGDGARDLAVLRKKTAGPIRAEDLEVTVAHYGPANGGWRPTSDVSGDLYINKTTYFQNVPSAVWEYELGGYPIIKKWLGYREAKRNDGQPLTINERDHVRGMVQRIAALLKLHPSLDSLYSEAAVAPISLSGDTEAVQD